eukprot:6329943-Pyramimonas_sp.AAC.1
MQSVNVNARPFVPTAQPFVPASSISSAANAAPFVPSFSQSSGAVSVSAPEFVPGRSSANVNAVPFNPTGTNVGAAPFMPAGQSQAEQYEEQEEDEYEDEEEEEEEEDYVVSLPPAKQYVLPEEDDLSLGFHASTPEPPIRPQRPNRSGPVSPLAYGMQTAGVEMQGGMLQFYDPAQHMSTMHLSQEHLKAPKLGQLMMASRFMPEDLRAELQQRAYLEVTTVRINGTQPSPVYH